VIAANLVLFRHTYGLIHNPFKSEGSRINKDLQILLLLEFVVAIIAYFGRISTSNAWRYILIGSVSVAISVSSAYVVVSMIRLKKNGMNDHLKKLLYNRIFY
jgi:hypothetical protein